MVAFTICETTISAKAKVVRVTDKGMGMGLESEMTLLVKVNWLMPDIAHQRRHLPYSHNGMV